jgi:hypothetical protein
MKRSHPQRTARRSRRNGDKAQREWDIFIERQGRGVDADRKRAEGREGRGERAGTMAEKAGFGFGRAVRGM